MNKKLIAGATVLALAASFATVLVASAQTASVPAAGSISASTSGTNVHPLITTMLRVGPKGNAFMRGTIASVSGDVITVNSWGGTWTVDVSSSTKVLPSTANGSVTSFQTGDLIGVLGSVSTSGNWTINAKVVRDRTMARSTSAPAAATN